MNRRYPLLLAALVLVALCDMAIAQPVAQKPADGPSSVSLGDVYQRGSIKIEDADLKSLPSLPQGYSALNNKAYRISTDAVAAGPYTVTFNAQSVTDEQRFKSLRVLHAETDKYDPDNVVWVDRTGSLPSAPDPDYFRKSITAYSVEIEKGIYVIAELMGPPLQNNGVADLEVTGSEAPEVTMPDKLKLSVTIKNHGPQVATNVGTVAPINSGTMLSAKTSQGNCKYRRAYLYCKLGELAVGAVVTIDVIIEPLEDFSGWYQSYFRAEAFERDDKPDNNEAPASIVANPNPNAAPEITLEGLREEQLLERGSPVVLNATATDADGSITKVEFFDNGKPLGVGLTSDAKHFSFTAVALPGGRHFIEAIATDNGGRHSRSSSRHFFVNGPIKVRILEPKPETLITPGTDLTLTVEAIHNSGEVKTVELFTTGISLGNGIPAENNRYLLKMADIRRARYSIQAVATDTTGLVSMSPLLELKVSTPPRVSIKTPVSGTRLFAPADIDIVLDLNFSGDASDAFERVKIYANDKLIDEDSVMTPGKHSFVWENVPAGEYTLKAIAIDGVGASGESAAVKVVVRKRQP